MESTLAVALSLKFIGAIAGAVLALVFQPPKTRKEFIRRAILSLLCGFLFGEVVREYFKWADDWQMNLAATAVTSMLSWFVVGAVIRFIRTWKPKED